MGDIILKLKMRAPELNDRVFKKLFCSLQNSQCIWNAQFLEVLKRCQALWKNHFCAKCFSLPEVQLNGWKEGSLRIERKTKGKIDLEKVSPFHFLSLARFLDVRECLSRLLSDYNVAPTAGETLAQYGLVSLTDKDRGCTKFHREWGMSILF